MANSKTSILLCSKKKVCYNSIYNIDAIKEEINI